MSFEHEMAPGTQGLSTSDSSSSTASEERDENTWVDIEPDDEGLTYSSLFDDRRFSSVVLMFQYCKEAYGFDIWQTHKRLGKPDQGGLYYVCHDPN